MAKDPAFLFYPNDWQGGTMTLSRHLKGCYMDLLIAQFNSGPLSLEEIKTVLGNDFAAWGALSKKFIKTEIGLFFNERLEAEKTKREEFSIKQKERVNKRWNKTGIDSGNTAVLPKIENENRNENEIKDKGVPGEKDLTANEISNTIEYVDRIRQVKLTNDQVLNFWEAFKLNQAEPSYLCQAKKIKHFRDWLKNQQNGHANNSTGNRTHKAGTSEARIAALKAWGSTGSGKGT